MYFALQIKVLKIEARIQYCIFRRIWSKIWLFSGKLSWQLQTECVFCWLLMTFIFSWFQTAVTSSAESAVKYSNQARNRDYLFIVFWNWSEFRFPKYFLLRKIKKNLWKHLVSKYSQYFRIKWNDLSAEIMLGRFRSALYSAIGKFFIMF